MDIVKFAEAVAWPIATVVVSFTLLIVTKMLVTKSGKIGLKLKDWFSFEASASERIAENLTGRPEGALSHGCPSSEHLAQLAA